MLRFTPILFFVLTLSICCAAIADEFWVSFGTNSDFFLMKVDDSGRILHAPLKIGSVTEPSTAMSRMKPGQLAYFVQDFSTSPALVRRVLIDERTFAMTALKQTGISVNGNSIQVTRHGFPEFLVSEVDEIPLGFGLNTAGVWDGNKWRVNPAISHTEIFESGVSPDGRMAWASLSAGGTKIYLQPLKANGRPDGNPTVAITNDFSPEADISNATSSGRRFLLFNDIPDNQVRLQPVDALTGKKVGSQKVIADLVSFSFQSAAIEPLGRFAIFSAEDPNCAFGETLLFQKLDANGSPIGPLKEMLNCSFIEIHGAVKGVDVMN